jgi:hypothetical protein
MDATITANIARGFCPKKRSAAHAPRGSLPRWTSGRMTFRLQPNRPARHDMLNDDAVILHHNTLHD